MNEGYLGTAAPRYADLVLLLEIAMGMGLLFGAVFARRKKFRLHALCQSTIVLLNLVMIVLIMVPSFHVHVSPKIPARLWERLTTHWPRHTRRSESSRKSPHYIFCLPPARTFYPQNCVSRIISSGCAACSCSGGSRSC